MKELNVDERTPIDFLEPLMSDNSYREASIHFLRIISLAVSYIISSKDTLAASYGVAFCLGLASAIDGKSMREIAKEINVSVGTISNHAKQFRLLTGLPTSALQCSLDVADNYRDKRNNKLK